MIPLYNTSMVYEYHLSRQGRVQVPGNVGRSDCSESDIGS